MFFRCSITALLRPLEIADVHFFKIFKNHEGDLSQKLPEPNIWLMVNHILKLISFNSWQLQNKRQLQNNYVNGAILITINSAIVMIIYIL